VIKVDSAEQANRLIIEGIVLGCDLKQVKRYDASCRITQCFKCQKYGHISSICSNKETCGHCGEDHNTEICAGTSPAPRKRCAACHGACHGGQHTSWSGECPARVKEIVRAKAARRALSRLFPISAIPPILREACGAQEESMRDEGWSTMATKKRKLAGRPLGAVNKARIINRDADQNIFSFTSQAQSMRGASEAPAIIPPTHSTEHSKMDCNDI
jgi:hypothetical protein